MGLFFHLRPQRFDLCAFVKEFEQILIFEINENVEPIIGKSVYTSPYIY